MILHQQALPQFDLAGDSGSDSRLEEHSLLVKSQGRRLSDKSRYALDPTNPFRRHLSLETSSSQGTSLEVRITGIT
jgi:hypothetical protein